MVEERLFMMVKFRELINPVILNECKWVKFFGDSEYRNDDGELVMGYWVFYEIVKDNEVGKIPYRLDDKIDEKILFDTPSDECIFAVENDNGVVCLVQFMYDTHENS